MRLLLLLAALLVTGCRTTPVPVDAPAGATPLVSGVATLDGRIAFELLAPSHVAAIEVVYGERLSALAPADSSGPFTAGTYALTFRTISTTRAPDPAAPHFATRVVQTVAYEPCADDPPVRYDPVAIEPGRSGERVMVRRDTRYCLAPAGRQRSVGAPPASSWVIVLASDAPIDLDLVAANLTIVGSSGFAPHLLARVAAAAMTGHGGTWSAAAARR